MKIFILEDDPRRMVYFKKIFCDDNVIWVETAEEALDYLKDNYDEIDHFFLDHDLGGMQFISSDEFNTGYTVAKFMADKSETFGNVVIHSMNPTAAIKMESVLPGSERVPFYQLQEKMEIKA